MFDFIVDLFRYLKLVRRGWQSRSQFHFRLLPRIWKRFTKAEKIIGCVCLFALVFGIWQNTVLAYTHFSVPVADFGGELTEGIVGQPRYLNPIFATSNADVSLTKLIFSGLYRYDQNGQIIPDLARSMPQISENQREYTVELKQNATWHNGTPVTADDVVFTFQSIQNPEVNSPYKDTWLTTSISKTNDYTVIFKTENVVAPFIYNLTLPLISKNTWSKVEPKNFAASILNLDNAIGSGPYTLQKITKNKNQGKAIQIALGSYQSFYESRANIAEINFIFYDTIDDAKLGLTSRSIDSLGGFASDVSEGNSAVIYNTYSPPINQAQIVFLNNLKGITADKNMRNALEQSIDRQEISNTVFHNQVVLSKSPFFPAQLNQDNQETRAEADLVSARTTLEATGLKPNEAGILQTKNGTATIHLITTKSKSYTETAELLKKYWENLGLQVSITAIDTKEIPEKIIKNRDFDAFLYSYKLDADPDPFAFWHSSQISNSGLNISGFANSDADKLIIAGRTQLNPQTRQTKYQEFLTIFDKQTPAIILNQSVFVYKIDKKVKNINYQFLFDPSDRFNDARNWYITEGRSWKF